MAVATFCLLGAGSVAAAPPHSAAVGRAHAQKAARLADQGNCKSAISEYSRAFEILNDPAILFNRAECQRKLDRSQDALTDYETFLVELPKAPNRPTVETRIDELRKKLKLPPAGTDVAKPTTPAAPTMPSSAPILDDDDEASATADPKEQDLSFYPASESGTAAVALGRDEEPTPTRGNGVSPWVWIGLGAALVAAGTVAGVLILGNKTTDIPESGLGNYKF